MLKFKDLVYQIYKVYNFNFNIVFFCLLLLGWTPAITQTKTHIIYEEDKDSNQEDSQQTQEKTSTKLEDIPYTKPSDIKNDIAPKYLAPHNLSRLYLFTKREHLDYKCQYLGTDGSPIKMPFYTLPESIGTRSGLDSYTAYLTKYEDLIIHLPKFPYTYFYFIPGSKYSKLKLRFSLPIKKTLTIGMKFKNISNHKEKPIKALVNRLNDLTLFLHHKPEKGYYENLVTFSSNQNNTIETGGIQVNSKNLKDYFDEKAKTRFIQGELANENSSKSLTIYNQLNVNKDINIYHELIWQTENHIMNPIAQKTKEKDIKSVSNSNAYLTDLDYTKMTSWTNEIGIKGQRNNNSFYRVYGKTKYIKHIYRHITTSPTKITEYYLGTNLRHSTNNNAQQTTLEAEYLLKNLFKVSISYLNKYILTSLTIAKYKPSIIETDYQTAYRRGTSKKHKWRNSFIPPLAIKLAIKSNIEFENIKIYPYANIIAINNPIVTVQTTKINLSKTSRPTIIGITPIQRNSYTIMLSPGMQLNLKLFKYINLDTDISINKFIGPEGKVFEVINNYKKGITSRITYCSKLYYANYFYTNKIYLESGINISYSKGQYDYDPISQLFFGQTYFETSAYPIIDLFTAFTSHGLTLFFIYKNINQGVFAPGSFAAPLYQQENRALHFGISWTFFD
jgi:hypothetical protein